jgi:hypothetical protein
LSLGFRLARTVCRLSLTIADQSQVRIRLIPSVSATMPAAETLSDMEYQNLYQSLQQQEQHVCSRMVSSSSDRFANEQTGLTLLPPSHLPSSRQRQQPLCFVQLGVPLLCWMGAAKAN